MSTFWPILCYIKIYHLSVSVKRAAGFFFFISTSVSFVILDRQYPTGDVSVELELAVGELVGCAITTGSGFTCASGCKFPI